MKIKTFLLTGFRLFFLHKRLNFSTRKGSSSEKKGPKGWDDGQYLSLLTGLETPCRTMVGVPWALQEVPLVSCRLSPPTREKSLTDRWTTVQNDIYQGLQDSTLEILILFPEWTSLYTVKERPVYWNRFNKKITGVDVLPFFLWIEYTNGTLVSRILLSSVHSFRRVPTGLCEFRASHPSCLSEGGVGADTYKYSTYTWLSHRGHPRRSSNNTRVKSLVFESRVSTIRGRRTLHWHPPAQSWT